MEAMAREPISPMKARCCVASHVGCVRENNEDNYYAAGRYNQKSERVSAAVTTVTDTAFIGVFDGMGGGEAGEIASRLAAESLDRAAADLPADGDRNVLDELVQRSFLRANGAIVDMQSQTGVFGTTASVLALRDRWARVYHLGDSRVYLCRGGRLSQLTRDQTVARMKIDAGFYPEDDPRVEQEKHQLTEYVGKDPTREHLRPLMSEWIPLRPGDQFLLCSDGLYDMCPDEKILRRLDSEQSLPAIVNQLLNDAITAGGEDNVTCVLVRIESLPPVPEENET